MLPGGDKDNRKGHKIGWFSMNSISNHMEPQGDQNGYNGLFVTRQQIIDERVENNT